MVWQSKLGDQLGRPELLSDDMIRQRSLTSLPSAVTNQFPAGFALLEAALKVGSKETMPSPEEWHVTLGIRPILDRNFKSYPVLVVRRRNGRFVERSQPIKMDSAQKVISA